MIYTLKRIPPVEVINQIPHFYCFRAKCQEIEKTNNIDERTENPNIPWFMNSCRTRGGSSIDKDASSYARYSS
jgi:hypothetical protein